MDTRTIDQETPAKPRRHLLLKCFAGLLTAGLLAVAAWYFGSYPCKVGHPTGATITVRGESLAEHATVTLDGARLEELCSLLKKTRPTFFLEEHEGINNENAVITLTYADGGTKTFSLFYRLADDILYEGDAEELAMASMYEGDFVHAGGSATPGLREFLQQFLPRVAPMPATTAGE